MARSVRQAQRSRESRANSLLVESIVQVGMHFDVPSGTIALGQAPLAPFERPVVELPRFDPLTGSLWFMGALVKKLRSDAKNQKRLLACWQEEEWARLLYDPLSPDGEMDPHKRFFDTLAALNVNHATTGLIEFHPDGGERCYWLEGPRALELLAAHGDVIDHARRNAQALQNS